MSYRAVVDAINKHGGALDKSSYSFGNKSNNIGATTSKTTSVNPYSSNAYTLGDYRGFANSQPDIIDERTLYSQMGEGMSSFDKNLMTGVKGLEMYSLGNKVSGSVQGFGENISNYLSGNLKGTEGALGGKGGLAKGSLDLGPALSTYSMFGTDSNPYTFTTTEKYGGTASNLMAAHQVSKFLPVASGLAGGAGAATAGATGLMGGSMAINPYMMLAALAFSFFNNKRRKKKAKRANEKVSKEIGEEQSSQYDERSEMLEEMRDKRLAQQGSQEYAQGASRYSNQYGGNYSNRFQGQAASGMKYYDNGGQIQQQEFDNTNKQLNPQQLTQLAKSGRNGDTMLAHINEGEAAMLKSLGGSGTINPHTGLREFGYGNPLDVITDVITGAGDVVSDVVGGVIGGASDVVGGATDIIGDVTTGVLEGATDVMSTVGDVVEPVLTPVFDTAHDIVQPVMEGAADILEPIAAGTLDVFGNVIEGTLDGIKTLGHDVLIPAATAVLKPIATGIGQGIDFIEDILFGGGDDGTVVGNPGTYHQQGRGVMGDGSGVRGPQEGNSALQALNSHVKSQPKTKSGTGVKTGDWVGDKENPYITANVDEELDYAAQGMKYKYADGGNMDVVAEFTGNELIVNDQQSVEQGLSTGNYAMAAAPIRSAMKMKQITPGPETHKNNPMPVDGQGNIYAGGGKLNFKVNKGAGVYDHATDQFKSNMTDREIATVAHKNISKWQANGMA